MKKVLSIILSVLMVVSCMTCMFTTASAATGTAYGSYVSFNQPGENLIADFDADNLGSGSDNCDWRANYQNLTAEESAAGGNAFKYQAGTINYQGFHISLVDDEGNSLVEPGREYTLSFYLKNPYYTLNNLLVYYSSDWEKVARNGQNGDVNAFIGYGYTSNSGSPDSSVTKLLRTFVNKTVANAEWVQYSMTLTAANTTTAEGCHVDIFFEFGDPEYDKTTLTQADTWFAVSDLVLATTDTRITADIAGTNGAVAAVAGENSVAFTATPYQDSEFIGWYDGETVLGTDTTYTYTYETVAEKVISAKFTDTNLLYGKNVANTQQTTHTGSSPSSTVVDETTGESTTVYEAWYGAVSDTIGWWSNGWARNKWAASDVSHFGGDSIYNTSLGYQCYVYTMHVKPNTTYSIQFSMKSSGGPTTLYLVDNTSTWAYKGSAGGDSGGMIKNTEGLVKSWINSTTDCSSFSTYTAEFTTNASDAETIPYYIYLKYGATQTHTTAYTGTYISDLSLIEVNYADTYTVSGAGAVIASRNSARVGATVTYKANAYDGNSFLGYYKNDELLTTDSEYTARFDGTAIIAKFTGTNLAADVDTDDFYLYNPNGGADCHSPKSSASEGDVNLGGNSIVFSQSSWGESYFWLDLAANTKYTLTYYSKSASDSFTTDCVAAIYKKSEVEAYTAAKAEIQAEYDAGEREYSFQTALWEFTPAKFPDYCIYREAVGGGYTASTDFAKHTATFTTTDAGEYIIDFKFANVSGLVNIADICLSPVYTAAVNDEGNGVAKLTNDNGKYTFTAIAFQDSTFDGWYKGTELYSKDAKLVITNLTSDLSLTAKFSDVNLLEGYKASNFVHKDGWGKITDSTVVIDGNTFDAVRVQSVGLSSGNFYGQKYSFSAELTAGVTYTWQMGVKSYYRPDSIGVSHADNITTTSSGKPSGSSSYLAIHGSLAADTKEGVLMPSETVAYNTYKFVPTSSGVHYFFITFVNNTSPTEDESTNYEANDYNGAYLYNMSLIGRCTVTTNEEGNGGAIAVPSTVEVGKSSTLTATEYKSGGKFLGWYNNGELVSTNKVITVENITAPVTYTAKFTKTNVAKDINIASSGTLNSTGLSTTLDTGWKKSPSSGMRPTTSNDDSCYGGSAIKWTDGAYQAMYLPIQLKTGTKYNMSFSFYCQGVTVTGLRMYKSDLNLHDGEDGEKTTAGGMLYAGTQLFSSFDKTASANAPFEDYSKTFTTDVSDEAYAIYYLYVKYDANITDFTGTRTSVLSDLSIVEVNGADLAFAEFTGNSIRATGNQALRFKYDIASDILTNGFEGLTVKEVGAVAIRTSYLNGAELTVDGTYTNAAGKTVKPASGKFTQAMLDDAPTVALYNIGAKKDPTTGNIVTTDYTDYGDNYTVRAYMVIELNGEDITLYGEARTASVFAVMKEIQEQYADDASNQTDYDAVAAVLAKAADDDNTVQTYYDAWLADNNA